MTSGGSIAGSIRLSNASKLRVETVSTVNPIRFINLPPSRQSPTSGTKNPAGGYNPMRIFPLLRASRGAIADAQCGPERATRAVFKRSIASKDRFREKR